MCHDLKNNYFRKISRLVHEVNKNEEKLCVIYHLRKSQILKKTLHTNF